MADWKIRRQHAACTGCDKEFAELEAHYSVLLIVGGLLERHDHCLRCFPERASAGSGDGEELAFWRTRRPAAKKKGLAVDFDAVEQLFLGLQGREEERLREIGYLLSLLLMRKRRLKLLRVVRRDGAESMIVRRPRRQEELEVPVFDLTPERAAERREDLTGLFEGMSFDDLLVGPPSEGAAGDPAADDGLAAAEGESPSEAAARAS